MVPTLAMLRQLAIENASAACRLVWCIKKRMKLFLILCAGIKHEDEINPSLLEFRATHKQVEDGDFLVFLLACNFLNDKLGQGRESKAETPPVAPAGRCGQPADTALTPQQDLFLKEAHDNWQAFLDHM
jgi:hypothetical protein